MATSRWTMVAMRRINIARPGSGITSVTVGKTSRLEKCVAFLQNDPSDLIQFSWSLKNHMESEHEGKDVCCTHCNKMFVNPTNLKKHLSQRICQGGGGMILSTPVKQSLGSDLGEDFQVERNRRILL